MKRLLAFFALLTLGIVLLRLAVGDEFVVRGSGGAPETSPEAHREPRPEPVPPARQDPGGLDVRTGDVSARVSGKGPLHIVEWEEVAEGGGRVRMQEVYVLDAERGEAAGGGVQRLDRVVMRLFEAGAHTATVTADRAFAELRTNASGQTSLDERKDLDLRNLVFTTEPGSRLAGLRLELGDAKVRIDDREVVLTTARDQPVLLTLAGDRPLTLRGKGAQARMPRKGGSRTADVELLAEPVLEAEGITARARGRLHFVEDQDTGTGQITLDDDVVVVLAGDRWQLRDAANATASRSKPPRAEPRPVQPTTVRGDQFVGWLLRDGARSGPGRERQSMQWRQLVLTGAPATVELPGLRLETPRLTALPGFFGELALITAHGGASRLEQTEPARRQLPEDLGVATSQRRIHLVRPGQTAGAMHRMLGFPRWSLRPFDELQIAVAEGTSRLESGRRVVDASDGLRIARRDGADAAIVRGLGTVGVTHRAKTKGDPDLVARGNDGFTLLASPDVERLLLGHRIGTGGAARTGPGYEFDVQHGPATLRGRGEVTAERRGDAVSLTVLSPDASAVALLPEHGLDLRGVHRLQGELRGEELRDLDIAGWPVALQLERAGEAATARAPRVLQLGPRSFRLLPPDDDRPSPLWLGLPAADRMPVVLRTAAATAKEGAQSIEVRGPQLDVHQVTNTAATVDAVAVGDERPQMFARIGHVDGQEPTTIASTAERLRALPFLVPPLARRWHAGGGGVLADLAFPAAGSPWLVLDDVHSFELDDADQGHVSGTGKRLLVGQANRAALFLGDPETLRPARVERTHDGRTVTLEGAVVRMLGGKDGTQQALASFPGRSTTLTPTITLREPGATGLLAHMRAVCRGNIDVQPDAVNFVGPVSVQELAADGSDDAAGMHIDAAELVLIRDGMRRDDPRSDLVGGIARVLAKSVVVDSPRMRAKCAELELDVAEHELVARDPNGAVVTFPNGLEWRAPRLVVDWETMTVESDRGRVTRRIPAEAPK